MPEPLQTNSTGGLFGGIGQLLGSAIQTVGNVATAALPTAADLYKLKLQGDTAKTQLAADSAALQRQKEALAEQNGMASWFKPWMSWAAAGLAVVAVLALVFRRR